MCRIRAAALPVVVGEARGYYTICNEDSPRAEWVLCAMGLCVRTLTASAVSVLASRGGLQARAVSVGTYSSASWSSAADKSRPRFIGKLEFYLTAVRQHGHGAGPEVYLLLQLATVEFDSYSGAWHENMRLSSWMKSLEFMRTAFAGLKAWDPHSEAEAERFAEMKKEAVKKVLEIVACCF